jgi:hypothetical protein
MFYAHALAGDGIKINALARPAPLRPQRHRRRERRRPAEATGGAMRLPDDEPSSEFFSRDGTPDGRSSRPDPLAVLRLIMQISA